MTRFLLLSVLCGLLFGCAPAEYSAQDLAARGAKQIEGVVTKQSRGSFILGGEGEETIFRTGEMTQYLPPDYRSLEGDTVRVSYIESFENSGKLKRTVLQLAAVNIPENNRPLPNPIRGEVVRVGKGSTQHSKSLLVKIPGREDAFPIYIPFAGIPTQTSGQSAALQEDLVGKRVEIVARRIPILRGNAYLYEAQQIAIAEK